MEGQRWLRAKELFAAVLDVPAGDREEYLAAACDGDIALCREVEGLLRAHTTAGDFLAAPTMDRNQDGAAGEPWAPAGEFPERLGDFRLLRRLGGGGMGVVYLACQESLGREVALKIVRPDHLYFPGARERFRREVEAVARLQHPGIVPVLCVGEAAGLPYFAMERINGCSLADALQAVGSDGQREAFPRRTGADLLSAVRKLIGCEEEVSDGDPLYAGSWGQVALRTVLRVAQALNHAHGRGIVHRDVKPSNVMLTPGGQVLLLDFGIARLQGWSGLTRTGSTLGSLPYMSPEQIRGDEDVDERADVYALGVTLYEFLTGRLPFADTDTECLRHSILAGTPPHPRVFDASIPRDVETVCLKAIAAERERRYPTVSEFARDLERCLELRPIAARRAGPLLRVRRWVQRSPAVAAAVALAFLLAAGTPSALWLVQRNANARLREESQRANQNLGHALQAVDKMLTVVSEQELREVPRMKAVRLELLEQARWFFDSFLQSERGDPEVRRRAARLHNRLGFLQRDLGRHDDALRSYAETRRIVTGLMAHDEADSGDVGTLIIALRATGRVLLERLDAEHAEPYLREALALHERLLADAPDDPRQLDFQARTLDRMAAVRQLQGRDEEAAEILRRAVLVVEAIVDARPETTGYRVLLANLCTNLGRVLWGVQRHEDAIAIVRRAIDLLEEIVRYAPTQSIRASLAGSHNTIGFHSMAVGKLGDGERHCRRSLEIAEELAREHPSTPSYVNWIGQSADSIGQILNAKEDHAAAREMLHRAIAAQRHALEMVPNHPPFLAALRNHYVHLCDALMRLRRMDELHAATDALVALRSDTYQWVVNAAQKTMQCADLLANADEVPAEERARLREAELDRAMSFLSIAARRGAGQKELDADWVDGLRSRSDFAALLRRLRERGLAGDSR